jgi:hypothetical protein
MAQKDHLRPGGSKVAQWPGKGFSKANQITFLATFAGGRKCFGLACMPGSLRTISRLFRCKIARCGSRQLTSTRPSPSGAGTDTPTFILNRSYLSFVSENLSFNNWLARSSSSLPCPKTARSNGCAATRRSDSRARALSSFKTL